MWETQLRQNSRLRSCQYGEERGSGVCGKEGREERRSSSRLGKLKGYKLRK